jgi:zinc transporter ZupT
VRNLDDDGEDLRREEVLVVGLTIFVSLSLHNMAEGLTIMLASQDGVEKGIRLACAISLENFPEGFFCALPLLFATRCRRTACSLALLAGMFEALGVLLFGVFFRPWVSQVFVSSLLASIAGILVYVAIGVVLPLAVKTASVQRRAEFNAWIAIGVISATMIQPMLMYHARVGAVQ